MALVDSRHQTVIVTGAASGIGLETVRLLADENRRLIAVDLDQDGLRQLQVEIEGDLLEVVCCDLTHPSAAQAVMAMASKRSSRFPVGGLVNVAGVNDDFSRAHETSDVIWQRVIDVNLSAVFRLTRAVLPAMLENRSGSIVNISSLAGMRGNAAGCAYTASKHGLIGLTKSIAFMYSDLGIRANAIAPGRVDTGIAAAEPVSQLGVDRLLPSWGLQEVGISPGQVAACVEWFLSAESGGVSGAVLPMDGGWSGQ